MLIDGEPTKRVFVEWKDLSKPSTSTSPPSINLLLVFCNRRLTDSTTSVIGGLNSFSGCLNSKHKIRILHTHTGGRRIRNG